MTSSPVRSRSPVRVPTILQMEALECGAAALAMVLAYHKRWVPLEEMRVLCGVSRDGSKALNLVKAARGMGLRAGGKRLEPNALATIPWPAILFVNMNHFVVFEGMHKGDFQINDPAGGRRLVGSEEFDGMFSGLVLVFEPTATFTTGGAAPTILPSLWAMLQRSRQALVLLAITGVLLALLALLLPGLQRIYVDNILISKLDDWVYPFLLALSVVVPLVALLAWMQGRLIAVLGAKLSLVLSSRMVWRVLRLPMLFFAQRYAGMISSRVTLANDLVLTLTQILSQLLTNIALLLFLVLLMLQYSPTLTALVVAMTLGNAMVFQHLRKAIGEASEKSEMQLIKMAGKAMQGVHMMETLKSTGTDDAFFAQWAGLQALYINAQQEITRREAMIAALQTWLGSLAAATVLVIGGYFTMSEQFSIGMLVAFSTITILFNQPVMILVMLAGTIQQTRGKLAQIDDTLRYPESDEFNREPESAPARAAGHTSAGPAAPIAASPLRRLSGKVRLENIGFSYGPLDPPLIEGFALEMTPGSRVALVGGSGSGKSTLGKLIAGLMEPNSGQILFDDRPLTEIPRDILRNSLAVVDQEIVLFEGTFRDNISLWDSTLPQDYLIAAAKDALIHDFILSRRGGYTGQIAENGRNLSGGQRQRLEIARALATNPTLLVLDEATSALDTVTEEVIMNNLRRRGCTTLIIAHRLSTIRDCDEIIVLHRGQIQQRGTHSQLIALDGPYRRLLET